MARNRSKRVQEDVPERAKLKQKALEMPLQLEHLQLKQPAQVSKDLGGREARYWRGYHLSGFLTWRLRRLILQMRQAQVYKLSARASWILRCNGGTVGCQPVAGSG